jgi:hypothetical protein
MEAGRGRSSPRFYVALIALIFSSHTNTIET